MAKNLTKLGRRFGFCKETMRWLKSLPEGTTPQQAWESVDDATWAFTFASSGWRGMDALRRHHVALLLYTLGRAIRGVTHVGVEVAANLAAKYATGSDLQGVLSHLLSLAEWAATPIENDSCRYRESLVGSLHDPQYIRFERTKVSSMDGLNQLLLKLIRQFFPDLSFWHGVLKDDLAEEMGVSPYANTDTKDVSWVPSDPAFIEDRWVSSIEKSSIYPPIKLTPQELEWNQVAAKDLWLPWNPNDRLRVIPITSDS